MNATVQHLRVVIFGAIRDAVRRRLFTVLGILSLAFIALYATGLEFIWREFADSNENTPDNGVDAAIVLSATLTGLAMFAVHFLGAVVGTFLVIGAVRGDAELGVLQQVLVRPLGRGTYLVGRFVGAAVVTGCYVAVMTLACMIATHVITGWWPDAAWLAVIRMVAASTGLVAIALTGSVFLGSAANGIASFMVFGVALLGGLLDQLGEGINSPATQSVARWMLRVLPFEAMYQWSLDALTRDTIGVERLVISLGPFGGARSHDAGLSLGIAAFCVVLVGFAWMRLRRIDL